MYIYNYITNVYINIIAINFLSMEFYCKNKAIKVHEITQQKKRSMIFIQNLLKWQKANAFLTKQVINDKQ